MFTKYGVVVGWVHCSCFLVLFLSRGATASECSVNESSVITWSHWMTSESRCLWFYNYSMPYGDAQAQCITDDVNATLLTFHSETFYNYTVSLLTTELGGAPIWVGVSSENDSLSWVWADGVAHNNMTDYHDGGFFDTVADGNVTHAVLVTDTGSGVWQAANATWPNTDSHMFICKGPETPDVSNISTSTNASSNASTTVTVGTTVERVINVGPTAYLDVSPPWEIRTTGAPAIVPPGPYRPRYTVACLVCRMDFCHPLEVFCPVELGCWSYKPTKGPEWSGCIDQMPSDMGVNPTKCSEFWLAGYCFKNGCLSCRDQAGASTITISVLVFTLTLFSTILLQLSQ